MAIANTTLPLMYTLVHDYTMHVQKLLVDVTFTTMDSNIIVLSLMF